MVVIWLRADQFSGRVLLSSFTPISKYFSLVMLAHDAGRGPESLLLYKRKSVIWLIADQLSGSVLLSWFTAKSK
jgi:hypothetical protein